MPQNENDLSDTEERPSIGEVIREWAVNAAAIVIIVFGIVYGVISIVRMEIRTTEPTVSSFESRFEKVDEQLVRADTKADEQFAKVDERFEKVDDRIDRLETKVDLNARKLKQLVESVNRMNRKMDAHPPLHNGKNDAQPNASLSEPDREAPSTPSPNSESPEGPPAADRPRVPSRRREPRRHSVSPPPDSSRGDGRATGCRRRFF